MTRITVYATGSNEGERHPLPVYATVKRLNISESRWSILLSNTSWADLIMMQQIPPPIIAAVLSFSALMMAFVGTLTRRESRHLQIPSWTNTAIVALALYAAFVIAYMLFMRKKLAGKMGERFRAQGTDPAVFLGLSGTVMFFSPTAVALFLVLAGIPLMYLYLATAFSIVGMVVWSAGYRSYER